MKIPFCEYTELPVSVLSSTSNEIQDFLEQSLNILDEVVYGMKDVKLQIMQLIGQWISNPNSTGCAIGIKGPPGTGKTTIVKEGISKILGRVFALIPLGGNADASDFWGHHYTYEGSKHGNILDIAIQGGKMNACVLFDELDKLSETPKGSEIKGVLTHLTDYSQNDKFHDKYYSELALDFSKMMYFFTYNDESKIDPILKDRMYCLETKGYNEKDKINISRDYLIKSAMNKVKFTDDDIIMNDEIISYIIKHYTHDEKGVRNLKRNFEIILTKLNLIKLFNNKKNPLDKELDIDITFPVTLDSRIVDKLLKKQEDNSYIHSLYM